MSEVFTAVEQESLWVTDLEFLRLHYAKTLHHWGCRFARLEDGVRATYGEEFRRAWELYLAGSEAAFAAGMRHASSPNVNGAGSRPR